MTTTAERRQRLRDALIAAAERTIETDGLGGLKARTLAEEVGCAVGAIYNAVADLDDLILAVNARTLAALERELAEEATGAPERDDPIDRLVRLGMAYLAFASAHRVRWRALFEHRLPQGKPMPDHYIAEQRRLFGYIEQPLGELQPQLSGERRALVARSLFSAVHGMVMLGLEEKLLTVPPETLREQVAFIVAAIGRGLPADGGNTGARPHSPAPRKPTRR